MRYFLYLFLLFLAHPVMGQPTAHLSPADVSPQLADLLHHMHGELCKRHVTIENGRPILWHTLIAKDSTANTVVPDSRALAGVGPRFGKTQQSATFQVRYSANFPAAARTAFSFAADIWATHVTSSPPIVIDASWEALGEGTLGSAGTTFIFRDDSFLPRPNTWYPAALAEALAGRNETGSDADIRASFSSDFTNWYFGTDQNTPASDYNFATVVLHEIGHGLGFFDSFSFDDGDASNGLECGAPGQGCFGFTDGGVTSPVIFDRFLEDRNDRALLTYANPSRALGDVLQSDAIFFDGPILRGASGDLPVQLFAPSGFEAGSSIAHLDEDAFPAGSPNSLMTPQLARQETVYSPGPFTCAIFSDMGWPLGADCALLLNNLLASFSASAVGSTVTLDFQLAATDIVRIDVERSYFNDPEGPDDQFEKVGEIRPDQGQRTLTFVDPGLTPGRYTYRFRVISAAGVSTLFTIDEDVEVRTSEEVVVIAVLPNPFVRQATVDLVVRVEQTVDARLYDAMGRLVARPFNDEVGRNQRARIVIDGSRLGAGVYFLHVTGEEFEVMETLVRAGG